MSDQFTQEIKDPAVAAPAFAVSTAGQAARLYYG